MFGSKVGIRGLPICDETGVPRIRPADLLQDFAVERVARPGKLDPLHLGVPVVNVTDLLDAPQKEAWFGQDQAADREEAVLGDASSLIQEGDRGRVIDGKAR